MREMIGTAVTNILLRYKLRKGELVRVKPENKGSC